MLDFAAFMSSSVEVSSPSPVFAYDAIYVSIGGKFNESRLRFHKPSILSNYEFPTNAIYQMVPAFIRFSAKTRALVIVIDDFSDPSLRQTNQTILESIRDKCPHITPVIYDIILTAENIAGFAKSLVQWIGNSGVAPEKCMIVNYLRFRGCPSVMDSQLENAIPRIIQNALNQAPAYANILYHWFGYQYYTYNIVFAYKEYNTYMLKHLQTLALFAECCEMTQLVSGNVSNMFMFDLAREPKNVRLLLDFCAHSVDITSYAKDPSRICSRLNEFVSDYVRYIKDTDATLRAD
jgi:hypothetical protein